jgi:uncharacterized repeat protein (TIGR01451 family)
VSFPLAAALLLVSLLAPTLVNAQPTGYQEYFVLGYEEHVWEAFLEIHDDPDPAEILTGKICSTVSLVATADRQIVYYDHWEDGYEPDLLNPTQSSTKIYGDGDMGNGAVGTNDILLAGDDLNLTSNQNLTGTTVITGYVPVATGRDAAYLRYDGGDRVLTSGGPVDLTHAMWPLDNSWIGGAWEMYSRQAYADTYTYRIPVGEDLYTFGGGDAGSYGDFRNVYIELGAFEDSTTVVIENDTGTVDLTLDRGEMYSSRGMLNSTSAPTITINAGTYIRSSNPIQVGLLTGSDGAFQGRFFMLLPEEQWGSDYIVPVPSGNTGNEAEIYISNPNDFAITVQAYDRFTQTSFLLYPTGYITATIPYSQVRGSYVPADSAARFTSSDGVFGVVVCAGTSLDPYDWGFSGIPAKYLTRDYYVSWAPGNYYCPDHPNCSSYSNGSPVWVTPLADDTIFYVDYNQDPGGLDDIVDESFILDTLEQRRLFDPDGDNTGMHIWATGEFAVAWGEDPRTVPAGGPYLDLGISILPLQERWLAPALSLDKTAEPTILPPSGGTVTFTLTAQAQDVPLVNVDLTDTLPLHWTYVPGSTLVTYPDTSTDNPDPSISGQDLYWDLSADLDTYESLALAFQASVSTIGSVGTTVQDGFESGDYTGGTNWTGGPWQESGESDGPTLGGIQVSSTDPFADSYHLRLLDNYRSAYRTIDLSSFTAPMLRFMKQISETVSNYSFYLDVYDGIGWTTEITWTTSGPEGTYLQESVDLAPYASPNSAIRFRSGTTGPTHLDVDAVEIYDSVTTNVNRGEATGHYEYADAMFNPVNEATVYLGLLDLSKSASREWAEIGSTVVYTLSYSNLGESSATNVVIRDVVPVQHVSFISASDSGTYNPVNGTVTWVLGTVPGSASGSVVFTTTVNSHAEDGAIIRNAGRIKSDQTVEATSNFVRTTVLAPHIEFAKHGPTVAAQGATITYTLSYHNTGGVAAEDVVISDTVPASTTYVPGSLAILTDTNWIPLTDGVDGDPGAYVSPTLIIAPGVVGAGEQGLIRYNVQIKGSVPTGSLIRNWATLDHSLDNPRGSNLAITRISELLISKSAEQQVVAPSGFLTYTLTYENATQSTMHRDVYVREPIPAHTSLAAATGGDSIEYSWDHGSTWSATPPITPTTHVRWYDASLPPGSDASVELVVQVNDGIPGNTVIGNIAHITSTESAAYTSDWFPSNEISVGTVDLWIDKVASHSTAIAGDPLTYTISYGNRGSSDAVGVKILDTVPQNTNYSAGSIWGAGADDSRNPLMVWDLMTVTARTSSQQAGYTVILGSALPYSRVVTNTATISSLLEVETSEPATTTVLSPLADVEIRKQSSQPSVLAGDQLTYTLAYTNSGPINAQNVYITDTLPADIIDFGVTSITGSLFGPTQTGQLLTWYTPTLPVGSWGTIIITATVDPAASGVLANSVAITTTTPDPLPGNNAAIEVTPVNIESDLGISKSGNPALVLAQEIVTYTIQFSNDGPSDAQMVTVSDTLPLDVTFGGVVSISPPLLGPTQTGQMLTWYTPTLPAGAAGSIVFTVTVDSAASGTLTNRAAITATTDPLPGNNTDTALTTVTTLADLSISKSGYPTSVIAGETLTYTILVSNTGPSNAQMVTVSDTLPLDVTFGGVVSVSPPLFGPTQTGQLLTWYTPTLPVSTSGSIVFTVTVNSDADGMLANNAAITSISFDPFPSSNTDTALTTVTTLADLSINKSGNPASVLAGEILTYTLLLSNNGPSDAQTVTVSDTLPLDVTFGGVVSVSPPLFGPTQTGQMLTWYTPTLPAGASGAIVFTVTVNTDANGILTNNAAIASTTTDPIPSTNADAALTPVTTQANLSINKGGSPALVVAGETLTYTLLISNNGPSDAQVVTVSDTLPLDVTFGSVVSMSPPLFGPTQTGQLLTWYTPTLPAGVSGSIVFTVTVDAAASGTLTNNAAITSTTEDASPGNNVDTELTPIVTQADLSISKNGVPASVLAQEIVTYTLLLSNDGPSDAQMVTVSDTLPLDVTFGGVVSVSPPLFGPTQTGQLLTWYTPTLPAGASGSVVFTVTVDTAASGTLTNTAVITSTTSDPFPSSNTDTALTTVTTVADLIISKSGNPASVFAGEVLTYTLLLSNDGPSDAQTVTVSDTLPLDVTFGGVVSVSPPLFGPTQTGQMLTWYTPTLPTDASGSIVFTVTVDSSASGTLTNSAAITSTAIDPLPGSNADTALTTATTQADLNIGKGSSPGVVVAGETLTYTLLVSNTGPSDAQMVTVSDTLPLDVTFGDVVSVSPPLFGPTQTGQVVTWFTPTLPVDTYGSIVFTVTVNSDASGFLTNSAAITSTTNDLLPSTNTDTELTTVTTLADISISKSSSPVQVDAGDIVTYTLFVSNDGASDAQLVTVSDTLPLSVTFGSVIGADPPMFGPTQTGQLLTWYTPTLPAGAFFTIQFGVMVDPFATSTLTNSAGIASTTPDPIPGDTYDETYTPVNPGANLSIVKTSAPPAVYFTAETVTYTLTYANEGPLDAVDVHITDTLSISATYGGLVGVPPPLFGPTQTGQTLTWYTPTLRAGTFGTIVFTVTVSGDTGTIITNHVEIDSTTLEPAPADNQCEHLLPFGIGLVGAKTGIDQTGPALYPTDWLQYQVVVTNTYASYTQTQVTLSDPVPTHTTYVGGSLSCSPGIACGVSGGVVTAYADVLDPGGVFVVSFQVQVDPGTWGETITNQAHISSTLFPNPPQPAPVTHVVTTSIPGITITKTVNPNVSPSPDSWAKYTFVVTNTGDTPLTAIQVWDDQISPKIGPFSVPDLDVGESHTIERWWPIDFDTLNTATASAQPPGYPGLIYGVAEAYYDVTEGLTITLDVQARPDAITGTQTVTYTYLLTNPSPDWLENGTITDTVYGTIATGISLAPGDSLLRVVPQTVSSTTENVAYARGTDRLGGPVVAMDSALVLYEVRYYYLPIAFRNFADP